MVLYHLRLKARWLYLEIILAIFYISVVLYKQYRLFYSLNFVDFDMSIFHQGIWLISRFHVPFVTVRGLNLFGDHTILLI